MYSNKLYINRSFSFFTNSFNSGLLLLLPFLLNNTQIQINFFLLLLLCIVFIIFPFFLIDLCTISHLYSLHPLHQLFISFDTGSVFHHQHKKKERTNERILFESLGWCWFFDDKALLLQKIQVIQRDSYLNLIFFKTNLKITTSQFENVLRWLLFKEKFLKKLKTSKI